MESPLFRSDLRTGHEPIVGGATLPRRPNIGAERQLSPTGSIGRDEAVPLRAAPSGRLATGAGMAAALVAVGDRGRLADIACIWSEITLRS